MLRSLHKIPGLLAAVFLIVLTLSGAALSVLPAYDRVTMPAVQDSLSVGVLAERIVAQFPNVEQISRAPSGLITAYYYEGDRPAAVVIDAATGEAVMPYEQAALSRWLTNLHRAFLLEDSGRIAAAVLAGVMLVMSVSGILLVLRRVGGWRNWFARLRGPFVGRLHVGIARWSVPALLLSAVTALFMFANTFEFLPQDAASPVLPDTVSQQIGFPVVAMPLLTETPVSALRDLTFPYADDATDVFTLQTDTGEGYIDQGTGATLAWAEDGPWQRLFEFVYMLHTGQGLWWLVLALGVAALGVSVLAVTGTLQWARAYWSQPRLRGNVRAGQAETILLVGSEGGTTWGFAATLHQALTQAGQAVHCAGMNRFDPAAYRSAKRVIVLAATYGEGTAPAAATGFIGKLQASQVLSAPMAVLGFGDRQFPAFCGFAVAVSAAAKAKGWAELIPMDTVDRQSPQDFARWGRALGDAMGVQLELSHQPSPPHSHALVLVSRRDYGADMQVPTAILRFAVPKSSGFGKRFPRFRAGDLLGIVPEGSTLPRLYSLASGSKDGFIEICVRLHPGGLCSGRLMALQVGDHMQGFVRENPDFRPAKGAKPVILIGAGTGIGPLAGFARANQPGRAMHLYFGARNPTSDLLYGEEMQTWQAEGRLSSVTTAFSRTAARAYVQDALRGDTARLVQLLQDGAQVLVCGGREMAAGVKTALAEILAPHGLTPAMLKAEGRYAEDVY